eukprot:13162618-Alexandrium_andersonii.AAC.1
MLCPAVPQDSARLQTGQHRLQSSTQAPSGRVPDRVCGSGGTTRPGLGSTTQSISQSRVGLAQSTFRDIAGPLSACGMVAVRNLSTKTT